VAHELGNRYPQGKLHDVTPDDRRVVFEVGRRRLDAGASP
jgi:hypothetical protein